MKPICFAFLGTQNRSKKHSNTTIHGREAARKSQELPVCYLGGTYMLKLQALHTIT